MTENDLPDAKPLPERELRKPKIDGQRAQWGFAQGPNGELIIRNWLFCIAAGLIGAVGLIVLFPAPPLGILICGLAAWALALELKGVQIHQDKITYPVRLGLPIDLITELPPLFMRTLPLADVSNATTETIRNSTSMLLKDRIRVAHLTGEFGAAKIVFDSKAGRDRLFAILRDRYPHIKVYRWT